MRVELEHVEEQLRALPGVAQVGAEGAKQGVRTPLKGQLQHR